MYHPSTLAETEINKRPTVPRWVLTTQPFQPPVPGRPPGWPAGGSWSRDGGAGCLGLATALARGDLGRVPWPLWGTVHEGVVITALAARVAVRTRRAHSWRVQTRALESGELVQGDRQSPVVAGTKRRRHAGEGGTETAGD